MRIVLPLRRLLRRVIISLIPQPAALRGHLKTPVSHPRPALPDPSLNIVLTRIAVDPLQRERAHHRLRRRLTPLPRGRVSDKRHPRLRDTPPLKPSPDRDRVLLRSRILQQDLIEDPADVLVIEPLEHDPAIPDPRVDRNDNVPGPDELRGPRLLHDALLEIRVDQPADVHEDPELARRPVHVAYVTPSALDRVAASNVGLSWIEPLTTVISGLSRFL
jgi:hypothetical protein